MSLPTLDVTEMADSSLDKSVDKPPPAPKLGRGLSRQYSIYPRKPSLKTLLGTLTAAIDVVKFLYTNDFTRFSYNYN